MNSSVSAALTAQEVESARRRYEVEGFLLAESVVAPDLISQGSAAADAIVAGQYETRVPPAGRSCPPEETAPVLRKIDNAHLSDRTIHRLVSSPEIGQWAAAITGAAIVRVFATQLLVKPSAGEAKGNVGWHQDLQYWQNFLTGELLTAWLAISDVTIASGPMKFVRGSHRWGLLNAGDFFSGDMDALRGRIRGAHGDAEWDEVAAVLPPGGVSFHHCLTVHGSAANTAGYPRKSIAIHLLTDRAGLAPGVKAGEIGWLNDLEDPVACPVIYRA